MLQCVTFSILILSKDADIGRFSYLHSEPSWREEFLGLLAIVSEGFIIAEIDKVDDVANKKEIKDLFLKASSERWRKLCFEIFTRRF